MLKTLLTAALVSISSTSFADQQTLLDDVGLSQSEAKLHLAFFLDGLQDLKKDIESKTNIPMTLKDGDLNKLKGIAAQYLAKEILNATVIRINEVSDTELQIVLAMNGENFEEEKFEALTKSFDDKLKDVMWKLHDDFQKDPSSFSFRTTIVSKRAWESGSLKIKYNDEGSVRSIECPECEPIE